MVLKRGESKPPAKSLEQLVVEQPEEVTHNKADETAPVKQKLVDAQVPVKRSQKKISAPIKLPAKKPLVIKPKQKKQVKSPDSNSNFLAAATLVGTEQQAELDESDEYTSKLATAQYKKIEKS